MPILLSLKSYLMEKSRTKKLNHFYSLCDLKASILDVGVSSSTYNDQMNLFLKNFRFQSSQYTGLAVESMDKMRKQYPDKKFVEYPGDTFPFKDKEFDWVFSNAVIEHVGAKENQILFINEMLRVSKNVFFTTPNKYFPVESHTNVFFRHWFDDSFYRWCKQHHPYWSIDNLLLLGLKNLIEIIELSNAKIYKITKNRLLGWPMTFSVVCND